MKTNIIHVLIVAMILVAGWSLFIVIQDVSSVDPGKNDRYHVIEKSKQYLPKASESVSRKTNYPVYKGASRQGASSAYYNRYQVGTTANSSFEITPANQGSGVTGGVIGRDRAIVANRRQSQNGQVDFRRQNIMSPNVSTPFSKNININPDRNIADASIVNKTISGSSLSSGNGIMKVFGGGDEGDDFEMGGGTENQNFYNDVPVGDGLMIMMFFGFLYAILMLKKQKKITI